MKTKFSGEDLKELAREALYELAQKHNLSLRKNSTREKLIDALLPFAQKVEKKSARITAEAGKKAEKTAKPAAKPEKTVKTLKKTAEVEKKTAKAEKPAKKSADLDDTDKKPVKPGKKVTESKEPVVPEVTVKKGRGRPAGIVQAKNTAKKETAVQPEKKPVEAEKTSAKAEKTSAKAEKLPVKAEKVSAKAEKAPVKAEKTPVKAEKAPAKAKKSPAKAEKVSAKGEKTSAKAEKAPAKAGKKASVEEFTEKPVKRGRGRPPKTAVETGGDNKQLTGVSAHTASDAAVKSLSRGFAKKAEDAPPAKNKKGAEVMRDGIAIPVDQTGSHKVSSKAEQIEKERSKRHSSLKTTMEVPIFQPSAVFEATSPISEDELTGDLPVEYGETRIVLQIRDPHWAFAYWEIPRIELKRLELEVGIFEFAHSHFVLRLHNVSQGFSQEIKLSEHARNWYIYLENPQTVYQVELGMHSPTEGYSFIALSNLVQTPPDRVAERWAAPVPPEPIYEPEERVGGHEIVDYNLVEAPGIDRITAPEQVYFASVSGEAIPHPGSSDLLAGQKLVPTEIPSSAEAALVPGGISSFEMPGLSVMPGSMDMQMPTSPAPSSADWSSVTVSSFGKKAEEGGNDEIFLAASVEIIVYGRVKCGCELTFQGNPINVRSDGSFSLRLALPFDGGHSIDLVATDPVSQKTRVVKAAVSLKKL